jgi:site-specific recombinase XerD
MLTPEDRQRIEDEERKRIAEEQYRGEVRAKLQGGSAALARKPVERLPWIISLAAALVIGTVCSDERNAKSREIPVRHDLEQMIAAYIDAAKIRTAPKDAPLFRAAIRKTGKLSTNAIHVNDICKMMKRRLKDAGLSGRLSPHSFRVTTITNLLQQGVPLEDGQRLAGHSDPRTTRLYDRRDQKITRNIVERISI